MQDEGAAQVAQRYPSSASATSARPASPGLQRTRCRDDLPLDCLGVIDEGAVGKPAHRPGGLDPAPALADQPGQCVGNRLRDLEWLR